MIFKVSDGSSEDTATLKIAVRDVNNNPPIFQQDVYNVSISELLAPGNKFILFYFLYSNYFIFIYNFRIQRDSSEGKGCRFW